MKKLIGLNTIYRDFYNDALFHADAYNLSENLFVPVIRFKEMAEQKGYEIHTMDCLEWKECEYLIFKDIPNDSILTVNSIIKLAKYVLKRKWRSDFLAKAVWSGRIEDMYLIVQEPEVVNASSHTEKYYKFFHKILTWNDNMTDGKKVFKYLIPQVKPEKMSWHEFENKKMTVLIASDKKSRHPGELYSLRRKWICFAQEKHLDFDLYGFGWNKSEFSDYQGSVENKLETLAGYKYCICFENSGQEKGYITEKIFDCFFAGCVPIYYGPENITDFIPENTFINMRKFQNFNELTEYLLSIGKEEYNSMLTAICSFLESDSFRAFEVEAYLNKIDKVIFNGFFTEERNCQ